MSPGHVERLRRLSQASATVERAFLLSLSDSDRELADSIAEETVANMTSGHQQPPTLEDWGDLSIDEPAVDSTLAGTPLLADELDDDDHR